MSNNFSVGKVVAVNEVGINIAIVMVIKIILLTKKIPLTTKNLDTGEENPRIKKGNKLSNQTFRKSMPCIFFKIKIPYIVFFVRLQFSLQYICFNEENYG